MKFPTLYKLSSTGALLQWSIEVEGIQYWAIHGQVNGKLIVDTPTTAFGKNVGRSNEVLSIDQAKLEAERKWLDKQKMHGYCEDQDDAKAAAGAKGFFEPTLAVTEAYKYLPKAVYISPKLDGLRIIINKNGAFTRNGKPYVSSKFIEESLVEFFEENPTVVLDGELYNHSLKDDFNKITSLARKTKASSIKVEDWDAIRDILQLHIFDYKDEANEDLTFKERYKQIVDWFYTGANHFIVVVPQTIIDLDSSTVKHWHDGYVAKGYEGAMLRDPTALYIHKRTKQLQKVKLFKDSEFEVVDFTAGKGKMADIAARVVVRMPNGETSDAGLNYKHDECREFLINKDKYIGKLATIKYFNLTPDGKLRFGKMIDIDRPDL